MAKRKKSSSTRTITRVVKEPSPVIRVQTSAPRAPAKKRRRSSSRSGGGSGKSLQKTMMGAAMGGFAVGLIEKTFPNLPSIPFIGRKGAIAIGAAFLAKQGGTLGGIARDTAVSASALAGYEFGKDGRITGDDVDLNVSGVASQV